VADACWFAIAEVNGHRRLPSGAVRHAAATPDVLPVMFFVARLRPATIGAGATPASALLAPRRWPLRLAPKCRPF